MSNKNNKMQFANIYICIFVSFIACLFLLSFIFNREILYSKYVKIEKVNFTIFYK